MKQTVNEEAYLLSLLKNGDEKAFEAIFVKYASKLYLFSLKMLKNEHDAEEIVQDTFMIIWEKREEINEQLNFGTYLLAIAKNKIYNLFRRRIVEMKHGGSLARDRRGSPQDDDEPVPDDYGKILSEGLHTLSPQQKEVVMLKIEGYGNGEIAERLSIAKKTVENHLNRAYKQLRGQFGAYRDILPLFFILFLKTMR